MARRRKNGFPWGALVAVAALAAAGYAAFEYGPQYLASRSDGATVASPALAVCTLPAADAVRGALGEAVAAPGGAARGVPAAGSCTWTTRHGGLVSAMVFTRASLDGASNPLRGAAYFDSIATGLEYAFKEPPRRIAGIGDAAVAGGFGTGAGQVVVLKGDTVLHVTSAQVDQDQVERLARAVAERL